MICVRVEHKEAFVVSGKKAWITGQDNAQFGAFWAKAHESGLVDTLKRLSADPRANVTGGRILGVSRVEEDPENRAFFFYIASECAGIEGCETYTIPECTWAIFSGEGDGQKALIDAEMYAFTQWLPKSKFLHARAPELEVYPERGSARVEFWLPISER